MSKLCTPQILLLFILLGSQPLSALENQFFSMKVSEYQPYVGDDDFFDGSIEFDSTLFNELTYTAPSYKDFSISISALLDTKSNNVEEIKGMLDFGGITTVVSKGNIQGNFKEADEFVLSGNQNPDELFQTLLPVDLEFKGDYVFYGIGFESSDKGMLRGIGYLSQTLPALIDIDTHQEYTFGRNPRTGEFENYHPDGTLPWRAVDAEAKFELIGLWVQYDTLREVFDEVEGRQYADFDWLFTADAIVGFGYYTPGEKIEEDYFAATGKTLSVDSSTSYLTNYLSYEGGGQWTYSDTDYIFALAAGVEGSLKVDLFDPDLNTEVADTQGELFTESSAFSYSFFVRIAASF
jgi:hypothetical protein